MKKRKLTSVFLALSLALAGCGRTVSDKSSSTPVDSEVLIVTEADTLQPETEGTTIPSEAETTKLPATTASGTAKTTAITTSVYTAEAPSAAPQSENEETESPEEEYNEPPAPVYNGGGYSPIVTAAPHTTKKYTVTATTKRPSAPAVTTTVKTLPADPTPEQVLESLTLKQKVCQMFMVTPEALTGISPMTAVGNGTANALKKYPVGGIIYFAQNLTSRSQISSMISNTQKYAKAACGAGVFTAIDEEGGTVARAAQKLGTAKFSNMAVYGAANNSDTAYNIGSSIGRDLSALGFNVDFAPVADVNINSANELGSRIFSSDPNVVANMVSHVSMGLQDNGVSATLKHFPGLGAEDGNTHTNSFVVINRSIDQLRETEFIPFKAAIDSGADFVMVGHQIVTGFGDDLPCDLSYTAVTEMLRGELGFDGIAVTDAQQMNTISKVYSSGEAAVLSVKAGMDIILMPADLPSAVDAVCNAVKRGEISEERIDESVMRILSRKYELGLLKK